MITSRDQAMALLNIEQASADVATVEQAFARLARRYPPAHFPEVFRDLLAARDLLADEVKVWRAEIDGPTLDLSWAAPYFKDSATESLRPSHHLLQALLRATYQVSSLDEDIGILGDLDLDHLERQTVARMLDELMRRAGEP